VKNKETTHEILIDQVKEKREKASFGGGKGRIEAQHAKGKKTARERIAALFDEGSFKEIGGMMTHRHSAFNMDKECTPGDGLVAGFGKINGRRICVYALDFTVMGGSFGEVAGRKVSKVLDLAVQVGVPVIGLNDGGGARIQEGVYSLEAFGELFYRNVQASGVIPQISVQLGPCAGGAVYSPALTDFIIMTQGISHMFITGPEVIKTVTGEEVDAETLGGAATHSTISGVAHLVGTTEEETFALIRKLLEYLPDNNTESPKTIPPTDDPFRADKILDTIVPLEPSETYDMHKVISHVVDRDSFFEMHGNFAHNAIVGFARMNGEVVGIVANQPAAMAGVLDINASDKIARHVRFCDAFNIPIITFVDTPGFMPGAVQEHGGIIRHGAKIVFAYSEATVPKITVITRKGYGGAYIVMGSKHIHADLVYVWPTAEIAVMGAAGAVNILKGRELKAMEDKEAAAQKRKELAAEYRDKFNSPYTSAGQGHVDDIILPSETRQQLINALDLLRSKQGSSLPKKHSNMPL